MANLTRSAKSGSEWTKNDLKAYNIVVQYQDAYTFFEVDQMPAPMVDRELLTTQHAKDMASDSNFRLISLLELAMRSLQAENSAPDNYAIELFQIIGYATRPRVACSRTDISFYINGIQRHATADVCLLDRGGEGNILLVQKNGRSPDTSYNAEPQLIAQAIAAFDYNNCIRKSTGTAIPEYEIISGIVLIGSSPIFYKIPVTSGLVHHVRHGTYPPHTTVISAHIPSVSNTSRYYDEGMKSLDNRQTILSCYEAFKGVMRI